MECDFKKSTYCTDDTLQIFEKLNTTGVTYGNQPIRYVLNQISSFCDYCKKDYFSLSDSDVSDYIQEMQRNNIKQRTANVYFLGFNFVNNYVKEHAAELNPELINRADFGNAISLDAFRRNYGKRKEQAEDLSGQKFGDLKVIGQVSFATTNTGNRKNKWECECSCGKHIITSREYLVSSIITNCGDKKKHRSKRIEDLKGKIFDDYKVIRLIPPETTSRICWECECTNCGDKKIIEARVLKGKYRNTCHKCKKTKEF